jgi:hypothetical protein
MLFGFDSLKLRPGEQLVGGNLPLAHCLMLLGEVGDALGDFLLVGQEEGDIKGTSRIEDRDRGLQIRLLAGIGSPLTPFAENKREFGRACSLSHFPVQLPLRVLAPADKRADARHLFYTSSIAVTTFRQLT